MLWTLSIITLFYQRNIIAAREPADQVSNSPNPPAIMRFFNLHQNTLVIFCIFIMCPRLHKNLEEIGLALIDVSAEVTDSLSRKKKRSSAISGGYKLEIVAFSVEMQKFAASFHFKITCRSEFYRVELNLMLRRLISGVIPENSWTCIISTL